MTAIEEGMIVGKEIRIDRFLAAGAAGEVWEGTDTKSGKRLAVKFLRAEPGKDDDWKKRFQREAEIAARIASPHVARVMGAGVSKSARRSWIAFELLTGETLETRVRRSPLSFADSARVLDHLLLGLKAAHAADVIHRDIKPSNLFLEQVGGLYLRILDFGVAKVVRTGSLTSGLTQYDDALGTPAYMSPEQLHSAREVDARTDIYSAGCVAYRLFAGSLPFEHVDVTRLVAMKEPGGGLPSLSNVSGRSWPSAIEGWVARALEYRPEDRFASAATALVSWRGARATLPIDWTPLPDDSLDADTEMIPPPSK